MGATDRAAFENLTRDRTIYRVLAHARCPVLTLREENEFPSAHSINSVLTSLQGDVDRKETTR
jgi:hypothetical protein